MPSRLMTVPEDEELQMPEAAPTPSQQAPWRVAAVAATFVTLLVMLGACTVASRASVVQTKSSLRKPVSLAVDEDVTTEVKSETGLPSIYKSVAVRTDEDTSFHSWAVTERHAVKAGDAILMGETPDGKKVAVKAGSSGIVMSLLDGVVDGDVIQRGTEVAVIAHPTPWPMGGVLALLAISSTGVIVICCGIAFTDPDDLLHRRQRPTKKMKKKKKTKGTFAQEAALLAQRAAAAGSQSQQGYRALPAMGKDADDQLPGLPRIAQAAAQIS